MSSQTQKKQRVVIAGLGDTGLLAATELAKSFEVIGVSPKPCLLSGQELGLRLTVPERWKRHYLLDFDRFKKLDRVQKIQAQIKEIDADNKQVSIQDVQGHVERLSYDALVIASGVSNGFWREPSLQTMSGIEAKLEADHQMVASSPKIAVLGAGLSGVACAANIAATWPEKSVALFHSGDQILPGYHEKTRALVKARLRDLGVELFARHRAVIPAGFDLQEMTREPVQWSSGQAASHFDLVLWTIGRVRPNSDFVPAAMKDEQGFVNVDPQLRVPGQRDIFAVGDIANTDPMRCSARNFGNRIVAYNVAMALLGRPNKMKAFKPSPHRWGSIFGAQSSGLEVYTATGSRIRIPSWLVESLLFPLFVDRMLYGGLRKAR